MNATVTANERLTQSREQLRQALHQLGSPPNRPADADANTFIAGLVANLQVSPGTRVLLELAQSWWIRQPARGAMTLASEAATELLNPVAQRHPFGLVAGAAAAGALLVWLRPWRGVCTSALLAGFGTKLVSEVALRMTPASKQKPETEV
jgi:hypothetical protein